MHEVTVTSSGTGVLFVLSAGCFAEVCHRAELNLDGSATIEATLQSLESCCSPLFIRKLDIDTANHVICQVVTDVQVLDLTKLCKLLKDIFIEVLSCSKVMDRCIGLIELLMQDEAMFNMHLKVLLTLASVNRHWQAIRARRSIQSWVLIHVLEQQRLTDSWLVVQPRAAVAMPTSPVTP